MIFLWSHCGKWHRSWKMGPVRRSMVPLSIPLSWGPANLLGNSAWRYLGEISLVSQYCYRSIYLYLESHYYFKLSEHRSHSSQYSKLIPLEFSLNSTTHSSSRQKAHCSCSCSSLTPTSSHSQGSVPNKRKGLIWAHPSIKGHSNWQRRDL